MLRRIGPLIPNENKNPVCLQTYFYDPQQQARIRAKQLNPSENKKNEERDERIFFALHEIIIHAQNKYLEAFLNLKEFVRKENLNPNEILFQLHDTTNPKNNEHPGRYHLPSCPEISILLPNEIPPNAKRIMVCNYRNSSKNSNQLGLKFFPDYHQAYERSNGMSYIFS